MKKIILVTFLVCTLIITIVGCSEKNFAFSNIEDLQTLTIGTMPDVDSIPFIIAKHYGFFKEEGIDVKLEQFKSALDRDAALQTGNIDGAISDMLAVVFFNDNDFKVKITSLTNGSYKLIAGKNSGIAQLEQATGKTVGISRNTIIEYLTDRIVKDANMDIASLEKIAIPKIPNRLEMLENGKLDMATLPEPLASVSISKGGSILNSSDQLGINPGVLIFSKNAIDLKSEEIKALYRGYNRAIELLQKENFKDYVDILIQEASFPETIRDSLVLPSYTKASVPAESEFKEVLKWLQSKGLTKNNYTLSELSNESFIK